MLVVDGGVAASFVCFLLACLFVSFSLCFSGVSHFVCGVYLFSYSIPDCVNTITIIQAFEDAIATDHDEVEVVLDLERLDVWFTHDDVWVASVLWTLRFDVAECL